MILQIHHTAFSVKDLERFIRFYQDLLAMRLDWRIDHRQSKWNGMNPFQKLSGVCRRRLFKFRHSRNKKGGQE